MRPTQRLHEPRTPRFLKRLIEGVNDAGTNMDEEAVRSAYRRWAPVYDRTFGLVAAEGRKHSVEIINRSRGRVLEVGVGTGLSLPAYGRHLEIVGIDLSPEMLEKARERIAEERLTNISGLHVMDAGALKFPDGSFDTVVGGAPPREGHARTGARVPVRRRRDHRQSFQRGGGDAWLGRAPHGAVRRHAGLATRIRHRSGAGMR